MTGGHYDARDRHHVAGGEGLEHLEEFAPIDRLARSTFDLFGIVKRIVDAKAQFRSLAEPWADTGTSTGRLMLAVLGGLADVEPDLIRTRTAEGRSRPSSRESIWAVPFPHPGTAERAHPAPRAGRYVARIGGQLRPQHLHHAAHRAPRARDQVKKKPGRRGGGSTRRAS